jgi:hypothetical protein
LAEQIANGAGTRDVAYVGRVLRLSGLFGLAALTAAAVAIAPAAPAGAASTTTRTVGGYVLQPRIDGRFLYYRSQSKGHDALKRLDLATGHRTVLYRTGAQASTITDLRAGGGRAAIGVSQVGGSRLIPSSVRAFDSEGRQTLVASGRYRMSHDNVDDADCGTIVSLKDVDDDGSVLTQEAANACPAAKGTAALVLHSMTGGRRILRELPIEDSFALIGDEEQIQIAGDHLLEWVEELAFVTDLRTGSTKRIKPYHRYAGFQDLSLSADGALLVNELRFITQRRFEFNLRLVAPPDAERGGRRVYRSRRTPALGALCGDAIVIYSLDGRRQRVRIRDRQLRPIAPSVFGPAIRGDLEDPTCDADRLAVVSSRGGRATIRLFPLH